MILQNPRTIHLCLVTPPIYHLYNRQVTSGQCHVKGFIDNQKIHFNFAAVILL